MNIKFYIGPILVVIGFIMSFLCMFYIIKDANSRNEQIVSNREKTLLILNKQEHPVLTFEQYQHLSQTEELIFWTKKGVIKE